MAKKEAETIVEWLIVHLAQSHIYLGKRKLKETLAWRMKKGKTTEEDLKHIEWAISVLGDKRIYLEYDKKTNKKLEKEQGAR